MQITIKNIEHITKQSTRTGKPFSSCKITTVGKEGKDIFLSGFSSPINKTWNIGDKVDIDAEQTPSGYWNFKENSQSKPSENPILVILKRIEQKLDDIIKIPRQTAPIQPLNTDVKDKDIPDFIKNI